MADILSQEEIDALLQVVDDDGNGHSANIPEHTEEPKQVVIYDFKRPNRVSKEQLRGLGGIHSGLARSRA